MKTEKQNLTVALKIPANTQKSASKDIFFHNIFLQIQQNLFSKHSANIFLQHSAKHLKGEF